MDTFGGEGLLAAVVELLLWCPPPAADEGEPDGPIFVLADEEAVSSWLYRGGLGGGVGLDLTVAKTGLPGGLWGFACTCCIVAEGC